MNYVEWYIQKLDIEKLASSLAFQVQPKNTHHYHIKCEFAMGSVTVIFLNKWDEIYGQVKIPVHVLNNPTESDEWVLNILKE